MSRNRDGESETASFRVPTISTMAASREARLTRRIRHRSPERRRRLGTPLTRAGLRDLCSARAPGTAKGARNADIRARLHAFDDKSLMRSDRRASQTQAKLSRLRVLASGLGGAPAMLARRLAKQSPRVARGAEMRFFRQDRRRCLAFRAIPPNPAHSTPPPIKGVEPVAGVFLSRHTASERPQRTRRPSNPAGPLPNACGAQASSRRGRRGTLSRSVAKPHKHASPAIRSSARFCAAQTVSPFNPHEIDRPAEAAPRRADARLDSRGRRGGSRMSTPPAPGARPARSPAPESRGRSADAAPASRLYRGRRSSHRSGHAPHGARGDRERPSTRAVQSVKSAGPRSSGSRPSSLIWSPEPP